MNVIGGPTPSTEPRTHSLANSLTTHTPHFSLSSQSPRFPRCVPLNLYLLYLSPRHIDSNSLTTLPAGLFKDLPSLRFM